MTAQDVERYYYFKIKIAVCAAINDTIDNAPNPTAKSYAISTLCYKKRQIAYITQNQLPDTPQEAITTLKQWITSLEEHLNKIYGNEHRPEDYDTHRLAYYKAVLKRLQLRKPQP